MGRPRAARGLVGDPGPKALETPASPAAAAECPAPGRARAGAQPCCRAPAASCALRPSECARVVLQRDCGGRFRARPAQPSSRTWGGQKWRLVAPAPPEAEQSRGLQSFRWEGCPSVALGQGQRPGLRRAPLPGSGTPGRRGPGRAGTSGAQRPSLQSRSARGQPTEGLSQHPVSATSRAANS
ncbi:unnamed protein product [Rangifer tarandus platyrhynchus]|uniref:Uncharacterized protein n=1 Tax=Rangifer tarandus platyrhynchus TaxID=3082113 RepID=A0AC60A132_RANTA